MRTTAYGAVLVFFLAVAVVFVTAPAMAASTDAAGNSSYMGMGNTGMMSNDMMNQNVPLQHQKSQNKNAEISGQAGSQFSGPATAGSSNEKKVNKSSEMKAENQMKNQSEKAASESMNKSKAESKPAMKARTENMGKASERTGMEERGPASPEGKFAQKGQVRGGVATVASVDEPGNCLRIRQDPSASSEQIGCFEKGQKLHLTGVFSRDGRWAQLADNQGWVFYPQIKTDVRPPHVASAQGRWEQPATTGRGSRGFRRGYAPQSYYYGRGYSCPYSGGGGVYYYPFPRSSMYWNWERGF